MTSPQPSSGKRICQVIALKKENVEEYKKIHAEVWDTVLEGLRRSHIVDYSINFFPSPPLAIGDDVGGLLIATFKYVGDDFPGDMKRLLQDETNHKWWNITDPMQKSFFEGSKNSLGGRWWYPVEEVFRFDG